MAKHREQHEEHIDESWLIPYADLLTLLLALFIVLFASSTIDNQKFNAMKESLNAALNSGAGIMESKSLSDQLIDKTEVKTDTVVELQELKKQLDQYIKENNMTTEVETNIINNHLTLTIRDRALFDSGSAVVKPQSRKIIKAMGSILQQYPKFEVLVAGHTDNQPIYNNTFESNWDLSSKRALNCMKIMLTNKNLDPRRLVAIGYGEYRPIAENTTTEGRAKNRRVEVIINQKVIQ
ncbi:OmpA/MotB domain protein [Desulforamulus reducens MI-1]|uniref:OmpA/MotB domain protein n=1 Tax=Desulforamulus reducens (strain ATCC BAA-1160 / DSM 100696 / MI-1) TaxID=349161 RepID=A4J1E9_DESRM|nr:flagellar motor protein MotB [Desulforamulus reducens]ABO48902.1 OmpA/MotB domain protein [Desulforamulus reducens MI-1]